MASQRSASTEKTICSKCNEVIFTAADSFLPDPFSPPSYTNVPIMDAYANGIHLGGCDRAIILTRLPAQLQSVKDSLAGSDLSKEKVEERLAEHRMAWLGR